MRKLLIILFSFFYITSFGQNLLNSRETSYFTYLFKITDKEAENIYKKKVWEVAPEYFHTLVDSFPTDSSFNLDLKPGHYLKAYTEKNLLKIDITSVQDFDIRVLNNNADLCIQVYDTLGNYIQEAQLILKNKKIRFDKVSQSYRLKKNNRKGLLKVIYKNQTGFFYLDRQYNNSRFIRTTNKVFFNSPVKYVWKPINYVVRVPIDAVISLFKLRPYNTIWKTSRFFVNAFEKIACLFDSWYCNNNSEKFKGYLVFNKPKYLPKDTVKFKAYIVDKKGKPFNKEIDIVLYKNWNDKINLAKVKPYNEGGYSYQFFLHDSLDLKLDKGYNIYLEYNKDHLTSGFFRYEDYELIKSKLSIRTDCKEHFKSKSYELYIKGTDENDMNLLDASIEVLIGSSKVDDYFGDYTFIPDTLWIKKQKLEPTDETKITIPDSIFPPANLEYTINVMLTTSDNEKISELTMVNYYHKYEDIELDVTNDSISFEYKVDGIVTNVDAIIYGVDKFGNKFNKEEVTLPYKTIINPYYSAYDIYTKNINKTLSISQQSSNIQCLSERTKDSLHIIINNPRKIPYNYYIYRLNKEIKREYTKGDFEYNQPINTSKNYYVSIQYLWSGKVVEEEFEIPFKEKELNVKVEQPKIVYPGQKTTIDVLVTNKNGEPVPDVDLTAYALTKKFRYNPPTLPYLGKSKKERELVNTFNIQTNKEKELGLKLDYNRWKVLAELDTIEYYKFIYPENEIYTFSYYPEDSITQFAPFVLNEGKIQPIGIIYVDNRPVYFGWSTNIQPYSFRITPGNHKIRLRMMDKSIDIDSIYFPRNKKTILSLDEKNSITKLNISDQPNKLTDYEKNNLYKYIFSYRDNFGEKFAYLKQNENIILLNSNKKPSNYYYNRQQWTRNFTGPVFNNYAEFQLVDGFNTSFLYEPFYEYDFSPKLLKMREIDEKTDYPGLFNLNAIQNINDLVYTEKRIEEAWEKYTDQKRYSTPRYDFPKKTQKGNGGLKIGLVSDRDLIPLNILLFKPDNPKFIRVYPGNMNTFNDLEEGFYRIIAFYPGSKYNFLDSLYVKVNGLNYYKIDNPKLYEKDNFSADISEIIRDNIFKPKVYYSNSQQIELNQINNRYQAQYIAESGNTVSGYVYGFEDGLAIPGVSVVVKDNLTIGTTTNVDGYYKLKVPSLNSTLVFSFVGMKNTEAPLKNQNIIDVYMESDVLQMDEVVVTALGVKRSKSEIAYSVSGVSVTQDISGLLSGKVAGLQINTEGQTSKILLRGAKSIDGSNSPLIIVDGSIYSGDDINLDANLIANMEVVRDASLTAIYGSRAANGVIIITTKDKSLTAKILGKSKEEDKNQVLMEASSQENSIRTNFSDYAFWQPELITDSEGKASFEVTFPDDVTNWGTYVLAMNGNKQTGQTRDEIKSYKPLMAQLALPRFLIQGDSALAIGKTLNYTLDTINLTTNYELNDSNIFSKNQKCIHSIIDSLNITATKGDTIKAKYYLEKEDGYFDGEQRNIPVFKKGLEQTIGNFYVLDKDTTLELQFSDTLREVNLYVRSDELEVIDEELKRLFNYKYLCNEQLASKLKAYLDAEIINDFKNNDIRYIRQINKIINMLENNQNSDGLWGWWNNSNTTYWISTHTLESLIQAKQQGYKVSLNEKLLVDNAVWELESINNTENKIQLLYLLKLLNATFDYEKYITKLETENTLTKQEEFWLIELKQLCNLQYNINDVLDEKEETILGNYYFKPDSINNFSIYENEVQLTLTAYKIIKNDSTVSKEYLSKIRNYFFEKRRNATWLNTYETSQIIETIVPDLLNNDKISGKQEIVIKGDIDKRIDKFPYESTFSQDSKISVKKTGKYPIYVTTYQNYWDSTPIRKVNDFEIKTHFENNSLYLNGGKPEKLIVNVSVKKLSKYVMIEVPIPAGCSYNSKDSWYPNEIHREYYKNQVTIFCNELDKGSYTFEIDLLPRYSGKYILNPAKIELMYFPTFNANNEIKKVSIE